MDLTQSRSGVKWAVVMAMIPPRDMAIPIPHRCGIRQSGAAWPQETHGKRVPSSSGGDIEETTIYSADGSRCRVNASRQSARPARFGQAAITMESEGSAIGLAPLPSPPNDTADTGPGEQRQRRHY